MLNGLQWRGAVTYSSRTYRYYNLDEPPVGQWTEWYDGSPWAGDEILVARTYLFEKTNGEWSKELNDSDRSEYIKPSEEQIKSILTQ